MEVACNYVLCLQPQIYLDASLQHNEMDHHSTVEEPPCPNRVSVEASPEGTCSQGGKTTNKNNYEQLGNVHSNRRTGV